VNSYYFFFLGMLVETTLEEDRSSCDDTSSLEADRSSCDDKSSLEDNLAKVDVLLCSNVPKTQHVQFAYVDGTKTYDVNVYYHADFAAATLQIFRGERSLCTEFFGMKKLREILRECTW
jgi:hypothetical protein